MGLNPLVEPFTNGDENMICRTKRKFIVLLSVYACFLVILFACGSNTGTLSGLTTGGTTGGTLTLSVGSPTGVLTAGTTVEIISLDTNVNATCKYATTSGVSYASMPNTFTRTGSTTHSTQITGLQDGKSYNYYVKCQDTSSNVSNDYHISFAVASAGGTTLTLSAGSPTGVLTAGTTQATISLTTNVNATCKYATTSGVSYASMPSTFTTTGSKTHSTQVTGLQNGTSYNYYVKCQDTSSNLSNDYPISFAVASTGVTTLTLSAGSPTGVLTAGTTGTTQTTISLTTNVNATCKYATASGVSYASMPSTFTTTGSKTHSTQVTGLQNGTSYNYYVKCQDTSSNVSNDYPISFAVATSIAGNSYYADFVNGSDSNNGSIGSPWKYLDTSAHKLAPGDTLYLRQGTFNISSSNSANGFYLKSVSGDDGAPGAFKTVKAYPGETPTVTFEIKQYANYWRWEGITFASAMIYARPYNSWSSLAIPAGNTSMPLSIWIHDIQIVGNTFTGIIGAHDGFIHTYASNVLIENNNSVGTRSENSAGSTGRTTGIYVSAGDNIIVRGNIVTGPADYVTEIYDEQRDSGEVYTRWITNVIVEDNIFYSPPGGLVAGDGGTYIGQGFNVSAGNQAGGKNIIVRNNIGFGTDQVGIQQGGRWDNVKIYNNTVFQPTSGNPCFRLWVPGGTASTNVSVENNIFDLGANYSASNHVEANSIPFTFNTNLYENTPKISGGTDANPIAGNPLFVNASTDPTVANFHIQASSAAKGTGLNLGSDVVYDFDKNVRTVPYDIGAYEFH